MYKRIYKRYVLYTYEAKTMSYVNFLIRILSQVNEDSLMYRYKYTFRISIMCNVEFIMLLYVFVSFS